MGLFDKKICDICGEKIGLLGNRKLDDGNLCKDCAKKLSPWFEDRRHSTVEDIKRQLEYREKNKKAVMDFCITRQINTRNYNVFIDDNKGNFTVARKLDVNENPDIVPLSAVVQCRVDVERQQNEETYTTKDGETVSYQPPVYKYEFDYTMRIKVKTPWFDDMDFRLNTFSISSDNRGELMEVEQTGHQIIAALTPNAAGMQQSGMNMNSGMQQPGMNMNSGMQQPGMNMNSGMQQPGMNMNNGMQQSGMNMNNGMQQPGMNMNSECAVRDVHEQWNAAVRNEHEQWNAAARDEHEQRNAAVRDVHEQWNAAVRNEHEQWNAAAWDEYEQRNAAIWNADEQRNAAARQFVEMSVRCREYRKVLRILWPAKTILSDDRQSGQNCSLCL